jgi:peptidoglycan/LPS O-acetylase OafA/YrhL
MYTNSDPFYVQGIPNVFCQISVNFISIWFMNLLFVLGGISTAYSLEKRSIKEYTKERFMKLFIPFIFGVVLTVPIQTYYAEKFHNGYNGGFFHQYIMFFTKKTDLSGYYGGFTPGHLWFLLFLFIISLLSLPVINYVKKNGRKPMKKAPSVLRLAPLFILVNIFSVIEIGESIGQYMTYFLIGFLVLAREEILKELENKKWILICSALILCVASVTLNYFITWEDTFSITAWTFIALRHLASWITILSLLGVGRRYFNFSNKWTSYLAKSSFAIYIPHQTLLIMIGYYVISSVSNVILQILIIMILGFISSILMAELLNKTRVTRFMFGVKK